MGIDPRTIKEMLQLQILSKSSLLSSGNSVSSDSGEEDNDFSSLLSSLLSQQQEQLPTTSAALGKLSSLSTGGPPASGITNRALSGPATASLNRYMQEQLAASKPTEFESMIQNASRKFGVDSSLVKAVIDAESSFNPRAESRAGAKGLMQLMDTTGQGLGVTDPFNPAQNIEGGTRHLSDLLVKYNGNHATALAAYNAGAGRVDRLGITNDSDLSAKLHLLPAETQQYVRKVMQLKQHYEA
ncbi:lytic transglycosylase domain-containing protein [Paenibacillus cremeus]|uniref:Lytic transglycosylase domain-containing protein n=1 Tax=Paenibacillus cremeus TaxID=2163881 RepID=A0A559KBY2_9BACL|nr:lytic transglycosylase domain-containing protein [Paenibacillus cremeus]TVY09631.1 lytic transglycosylase domain-containing protein [Paenibacillus cremeus]